MTDGNTHATPHLSDDDLVLHYYGELPAAEAAQATTHLSSCAACHEGYRRLQRLLAAVDDAALATPELPAHFERTVWARLEPNLQRRDRRWFSWFVLSPARLAWVCGIVALVGAAFMAGRMVERPAAPAAIADGAADRVRERILLVDLSDHLERSQMVLVEILSADDQQPVSMADERTRAEELVGANRLYRQVAAANGDATMADFLDDLEQVLVDVAATPETLSSQDLGEVRRRIESKSLLFKVRVVSSEVRQRQQSMVQERAGQRSSL
jgi:hypothetical protein